jgi:hypothetical protein
VGDHVPLSPYIQNFQQPGLFQQSIFTYGPSGGILLAGAAPVSKTKSYLPSGGIIFAGDAPLAKTKSYTPSGSILFAGSAGTEGPGGIISRLLALLGVGG